MGIKINTSEALMVLLAESEASQTGELVPMAEQWRQKTEGLAVLAIQGRGNATYIAMLGTALLAKAVHPDVDALTLKKGLPEDEWPGAYSARGLCKDVLAATAPRLPFDESLRIDLGVHSREPLNNSPFFRMPTVVDAIASSHEESSTLLLSLLREINELPDTDSGKLALRGFLKSRIGIRPTLVLDDEAGNHLTLSDLSDAMSRFIEEDSEKGKRAQAMIAGVLDVGFGHAHVRMSAIHDPDRRFPGDAVILNNDDTGWIAVEARDKRVNSADLSHFVHKVNESDLRSAVVVALAGLDNPGDLENVVSWATDIGLHLSVYPSLDMLLHMCHMLSGQGRAAIGATYRRCATRILQIEVSQVGVEFWASVDQQ